MPREKKIKTLREAYDCLQKVKDFLDGLLKDPALQGLAELEEARDQLEETLDNLWGLGQAQDGLEAVLEQLQILNQIIEKLKEVQG